MYFVSSKFKIVFLVRLWFYKRGPSESLELDSGCGTHGKCYVLVCIHVFHITGVWVRRVAAPIGEVRAHGNIIEKNPKGPMVICWC